MEGLFHVAVGGRFQPARKSSVNGVGVFSTLVLGALLGGAIAARWGVTGPFWFGFVGSLLTLIAIWPQLRSIAEAD